MVAAVSVVCGNVTNGTGEIRSDNAAATVDLVATRARGSTKEQLLAGSRVTASRRDSGCPCGIGLQALDVRDQSPDIWIAQAGEAGHLRSRDAVLDRSKDVAVGAAMGKRSGRQRGSAVRSLSRGTVAGLTYLVVEVPSRRDSSRIA